MDEQDLRAGKATSNLPLEVLATQEECSSRLALLHQRFELPKPPISFH